MIAQRLKILSAIIIAFILVEGYTYFSQNPAIVPAQAENIKGLLANIKFPQFNLTKLFTIKFSENNNLAQVQPYESIDMNGINNGAPPVYVPPTKIIKPTNMIGSENPTPTEDDELVDFPFESGSENNIPTPTKYNRVPTGTRPTKAPKPTKTPTPPPIKTDLRPGNSLKEIFQEVNKRACFPIALLMAFKTLETGERFKNDSSSTIKTYNTYGWWITGAGNPCYGYGYHEQTGIVPQDSVSAGTSCLSNPVGDPNDIKIMGIFQVSEYEQSVAQKYISSALPSKNDRRVLFDSTLMFAYITKSRVEGGAPNDCNNWPSDVIKMVAEKHHGICVYDYENGTKGDYCKQILDLYNQYK